MSQSQPNPTMLCPICKQQAELNTPCPTCGFENRVFAIKEEASNWLQTLAKHVYELQRNHSELQQSHVRLHEEHQETKKQIAAIIKRLDEKPKVEEKPKEPPKPKPHAEQVGKPMHFGGYDWRVLDVENNQALLISEKVLEKRPYNVEYKAITWEQCSLRKYLNNEFYNSLGAENSKIAQTQNPNTNNPWYGTAVGNPTSDKIFLLSIEEVVKYFGDSDDLKNKRRKDIDGNLDSSGYWLYDEYNNARMARDDSGKVWWWWLRSPGSSSYDAAYVRGIGSVRIDGDPVSLDSGGVRPALWLNL